MPESVYKNTDFTVKAIGIHSISSEGILDAAIDPDNPGTSLWVRSISDSSGNICTDLSSLSDDAYVSVVNNKHSEVTASCVMSVYDSDNILSGFYNIGSTDIAPGETVRLMIPDIDTINIAQIKISAYIGSINQFRPGGMPLVLNNAN